MVGRRSKPALFVIVAVVTAVAGYLLASGRETRTQPPRGLEIAIQDDAVFTDRYYYDRDLAFRQARALGAGWLRVTVVWSRVAGSVATLPLPPTRVEWRWGRYDSAVNAARAHGMQVELTLTGPAPAWATGDHAVGVTRPSASQYGAFVRAAAAHFRGRVARYSIWNEPNYVSWLRPLSEAPSLYRRLYDAGYAGVKSVDPGAKVLIGETTAFGRPRLATPPLAFLHAVACQGCPRLVADGYAHHPYPFPYDVGAPPPAASGPGPGDATIDGLGRLTTALDALARERRLTDPRGRPLDIYLTEFGYFESGRRALPQDLRARDLTRAFAIAASRYPRVRQMLQYLLVAPPRGSAGARFDTAIVSTTGVPSPAYTALANWVRGERRRGRVAAAGG